MFIPCGKVHRTRWQLYDIAGDIGRPQFQILRAAIIFGELDVVQHLRRDRARATEQIEGHARRRTLIDWTQRVHDVTDVVGTGHGLRRIVGAVGVIDVPEELVIAEGEIAIQAGRVVLGVHALLVYARTTLNRASTKTIVGTARIQR